MQATAQEIDMDLFKNMKARAIGPAGMSGRVTAIDAIYDNPDIIYAGTASGGLWKSTSGGMEWASLFDTMQTASIGSISIYQKNPDVVWVGTGEGNPRNSQTNGYGVYRTIDGGKNWEFMGLGETRNIHRIIVHPNNPDVVFVGAQGPAWGDTEWRGVFKTTDGGKTWDKILYNNNRTGVGDMVIDPANPDKLMVAMWEFRRWPWKLKSGGEGSGLYVTFDAGKTWQKRTDKDGLPKGELGRMGLAIANSNPNIVYALIESKKNALYRSEDGGFNWKKVSDKPGIGNRPFYYADIFVDTQNENRVFTLYSMVGMSEDGGKNFEVIIPYSGVHPDHHAWWQHPTNPSLVYEGNDGGMNVSRDRAKTWRFIPNLPLAQFYHINYDMDIPYNVMGGMQDNGSWVGPAYAWKRGGIRNSYWQEVAFGDGFDVIPDSSDMENTVYAMSQGGNLRRVNKHTGYSKPIVPQHEDGEKTRFNWNAAFAHDRFDKTTIYYGSQFVHKSTDRGENWQVISPDLTTNDSLKQVEMMETGGLTYDVTQAENHTTILAIEQSPLNKDVMWVGTDDGNVQLTQDGGKTWNNLASRLTGLKAGSWIPQIVASTYEEGAAFVVANDYRRHHYEPYVYHTKDFGQTWKRLTTKDQVWGHTHAVVQDPVAENLIFVGAEDGLYITIDGGTNWTKWQHGFPTVPTIDLKIHPREHDLVIGTFGRAAYILDDIRPLRELAIQGAPMMEKELVAFNPPTAYQASYLQAAGMRFGADAEFYGENRRSGAMLSFYIKDDGSEKKEEKKEGEEVMAKTSKKKKKKGSAGKSEEAETAEDDKKDEVKKDGKVKVEIADASGTVIRTMTYKAKKGMNRMYWNMRERGIRFPGSRKPKPGADEPGGGPMVLPGTYKVNYSYAGETASVLLNVEADPRMDMSMSDMKAHYEMVKGFMPKVEVVTAATDRIQEARETMAMVKKQMSAAESEAKEEDKKEEDSPMAKLKKTHKEMAKKLTTVREMILSKEKVQGIYRNPEILSSRVRRAMGLASTRGSVNQNQKNLMAQVEGEMKTVLEEVNNFFSNDWPNYLKAVEDSKVLEFKTYEPFKVE